MTVVENPCRALLFHLPSRDYEQTILVITTDFSVNECAAILGEAKMTSALLDRLTHHRHILENRKRQLLLQGYFNRNKI